MGIFNFLFKKSKEKQERHEHVERVIDDRKNCFTEDMAELQQQAKKVHQTSVISLRESKKLNKLVTDIASQVALATGAPKRGYDNH